MRNFLVVLALVTTGACAHRQQGSDAPGAWPPGERQPSGPPQGEPVTDASHTALQSAAHYDDLVTQATPELAPLYFAFNSDNLQPQSQDKLQEIADYLQKHPEVTINISGHCDERGTAEYNLALGDRRAQAARTYLGRLGVEPARVNTVSYGAEHPALLGEGEAVWAKNRRDELSLANR